MNTKLQKLIETFDPPTRIIECWHLLLSKDVDALFLSKWLSSAAQVEDVCVLTDAIAELGTSGVSMRTLSNTIDNSPFSIADWSKAILAFFRHTQLEPTDSSISTKHIFGYLKCCADSAAQGPLLENFETIVNGMLELHGYEGTP